MNEYYNYLDKAGSVGEGFDWKSHVVKNGGTEELAMKFPHMVARLEGERDVWGTAMNTLKASGLSDEQKSIALRHIKNKLDEQGDNKAHVTAKGNRFLILLLEKKIKQFSMQKIRTQSKVLSVLTLTEEEEGIVLEILRSPIRWLVLMNYRILSLTTSNFHQKVKLLMM